MHIAHRKFYNNQPVTRHEYYNRVVTVYWSFDHVSGSLTYGASVFRREYEEERWHKRWNRETAKKRFYKNPVQVVLKTFVNLKSLTNTAIEYFICRKLIYLLGCSTKMDASQSKFYDEYNDSLAVEIPDNFNKLYNFNTGCDHPRNDFDEDWDRYDKAPRLSQGCMDMMFFSLGVCGSIIVVSGYHYLL